MVSNLVSRLWQPKGATEASDDASVLVQTLSLNGTSSRLSR